MARARTLSGADYSVVALIGDGAMTGGLAYEGLNDAGASGEPLVVILNDNGMSIDPNVGGVAVHLAACGCGPATTGSRSGTTPLWTAFPAAGPCTGSTTGSRPT